MYIQNFTFLYFSSKQCSVLIRELRFHLIDLYEMKTKDKMKRQQSFQLPFDTKAPTRNTSIKERYRWTPAEIIDRSLNSVLSLLTYVYELRPKKISNHFGLSTYLIRQTQGSSLKSNWSWRFSLTAWVMAFKTIEL